MTIDEMAARVREEQAERAAETGQDRPAQPVSMTVDQAREVMARVTRHISYAPEEGPTQTEQDLFAACNTLISQAQALALLNNHIDTLECELTELGNMHRAACDELEECRAVLRGLYP